MPEKVARDARQAFERRSGGVLVARLVRDHVPADAPRELHFTRRGIQIEVDVAPVPEGVVLTVKVRPPGRHRVLLRRPDVSTTLVTDPDGTAPPVSAPTGPLSVVVLGPPLLQTEWLVV